MNIESILSIILQVISVINAIWTLLSNFIE